MRVIIVLLFAFAMPSMAVCASLPGLPGSIRPISLVEGNNRLNLPAGTLPADTPAGTTLNVFQAWRDNGNAWGHHIFLVTESTQDDVAAVIGADPLPGTADTALRDQPDDAPHTGEDAIISLVFATGTEGGKPGLFLLEAVRDVKSAVPDPASAALHVFQLVSSGGDPGATPLYFKYLRSVPLKGKFCSADAALISAGLEQPHMSDAPHTATGCFESTH